MLQTVFTQQLIRKLLEKKSNNYVLNGQLELLSFSHSSSEDSPSKIQHMEQAVPKAVVHSELVEKIEKPSIRHDLSFCF